MRVDSFAVILSVAIFIGNADAADKLASAFPTTIFLLPEILAPVPSSVPGYPSIGIASPNFLVA
jgi:hypothetical protein